MATRGLISAWSGTIMIALTGLGLLSGQTFDADIAPIFKANCINCHGTSVKMKDLNLSSEATVLKGGESGPVIVPGKPDESVLYQKVHSGAMPMGKPRLSEKEIDTI